MEDRWIKIQAKLLEWEWFKDGCTLQVFMYMLISASYKKETKYNIELEAGMLATNIPTVASMTGLSENWARHSINNLLNTGEISVVKEKSTTRFRVFRVSNWRKYQCSQRDLGFNDCTATTAPQPLHPNDCTSTTAPQSLHLTDCAVPPHTVEGKTPPLDNYTSIINNKEEEKHSYACARVREENSDSQNKNGVQYPIEWQKFANEIFTMFPMKKGNLQMALAAICKAIEDSGDFETFKVTAMNAVKAYAQSVSKWPKKDMRYVTPLTTFFEKGMYNNDPSTWNASQSNGLSHGHGNYDLSGKDIEVKDEDNDGTVF